MHTKNLQVRFELRLEEKLFQSERIKIRAFWKTFRGKQLRVGRLENLLAYSNIGTTVYKRNTAQNDWFTKRLGLGQRSFYGAHCEF